MRVNLANISSENIKFDKKIFNKDEFSFSNDYAIENIPKEVNFLTRKKWIKDRLSSIGHQKAAVFIKKSTIIWAFLNEEQKYWMPFEKSQFYYNVLQLKDESVLIVEATENGDVFYGLSHGFLVVYTHNYDEAIKSLLKNCTSKNILKIGIGHTNYNCDQKFSYVNLEEKITLKAQEKETLSSFDDEIIFLNEDTELYDGIDEKNKEKNIDDLFFIWFKNKEVLSVSRKKLFSYVLGSLFGVLFISGLYFSKNNHDIKIEIENTIENICKLNK